MSRTSTKRQRNQRVAELVGNPSTLRDICDYIISGGTVVEWCRTHDVPYNEIYPWLIAEPHRREKLDAAVVMRGEFLSDLVVRNLRMFADLDWGKAYDEKGNLLPVPNMPEDLRRALHSFELAELFEGRGEEREHVGYTKKIKGISPDKAVELLGKYRKMFVDRVEHSADATLEELIGASMQPEEQPAKKKKK